MRLVRRSALPFLILFALAGCGDDDPGEVITDLDALSIRLAIQGLADPLTPAAEARALLSTAVPFLTDRGFEFQRTAPAPELTPFHFPALRGLPEALPVEIPENLLGITLVYDIATDDWSVDQERPGAPDDGIRIIWYETNSFGTVELPLVERGYIDLVDQDTEQLNRLHVRIVATTGDGDIEVADLAHWYSTTGTDAVTEEFQAEGSYSNGAETVRFDLLSSTTVNETTGDESYRFNIDLDGSSDSYSLDLSGDTSGDGGEIGEDMRAMAVVGGVRTEMTVERVATAESDEQTGTLRHNGVVVALMAYNGSSFDFTPPDDGEFSRSQQEDLQDLARTLALAGLTVAEALPLLF